MPSFLQKIFDSYATAGPQRRAKLGAAGALLGAFALMVAHEAITGRPMKALGIFLAGMLFVGFILLIGFIVTQARKLIGKQAATWLGAFILLGSMAAVIGYILMNWGR